LRGEKLKQFRFAKDIEGTTMEEQRAIQSAGGKASGVTRRKKKTMQEVLDKYLHMKIKQSTAEKRLKEIGFDTTYLDAIMYSALKKAMEGDIKAIEFIRDTIGEKPKDNIVVDKANSQFDDILEQLQDVKVEGVDDNPS